MSPRLQSAALGGAFLGVLSALPFVSAGNCCCLWILGGGFLAAYLLQQEQQAPITAGNGAAVGFLAGIIGACVHLIVFVPVDFVVAPLQGRLVERILAGATDLPPGVRRLLEGASGGRASLVTLLALQFGPMLVLGALLSPIGGMLGAIYARRGVPPPVPPDENPSSQP